MRVLALAAIVLLVGAFGWFASNPLRNAELIGPRAGTVGTETATDPGSASPGVALERTGAESASSNTRPHEGARTAAPPPLGVVTSDGLPMKSLEYSTAAAPGDWVRAAGDSIPSAAHLARSAGHAAQAVVPEDGVASLGADALLVLRAPGLGAAATGFALEARFGDATEAQRDAGLFVARGADELALAVDVERWRAGHRHDVTPRAWLAELTSVTVDWTPSVRERRIFDVTLPDEWIRPRTADVEFVEVGGEPFEGERTLQVRLHIERELARLLAGGTHLEVRAQVDLAVIERTTTQPKIRITVPSGLGSATATVRRGDGAYGLARFTPAPSLVQLDLFHPSRIVGLFVDQDDRPLEGVRLVVDPRRTNGDPSIAWISQYGRATGSDGRLNVSYPDRLPLQAPSPGLSKLAPGSATLELTPRGGPTVEVPVVLRPGETLDLGRVTLPVTAPVRVRYGDLETPAPESVSEFQWKGDGCGVEAARAIGPAEHELLLEAKNAFTEAPPHAVVWVDTDAGALPLGLVRDGDGYVAEARYARRLTIGVPGGRSLAVSLDSDWHGMSTPLYSSGRRPMTEAHTVDAVFLAPDAVVRYELTDPETRETVAEGELGRADRLPDLIQLPERSASGR